MVAVRPLRLQLVRPEWGARVSSPAHDALSPTDRRHHLAANPESYMAVTRSLEDVEPGYETTAAELLEEGRKALERLQSIGAFGPEGGDIFYLYDLQRGDLQLTGVVGGVAVSDYHDERVRIHEHVKAERALHLAQHLDVVGVQSSPIAMAHLPNEAVARITDETLNGSTPPVLDVALPDGLRQRIWTIEKPETVAELCATFEDQSLYLIDGHHRAAAAATFRAAAGPGSPDWMLSAIFPSDQLHNAAHHRVFTPTADNAESGVTVALEMIGRHLRLRKLDEEEVDERADDEVAMFCDGQWYALTLPFDVETAQGPERTLANLDPSRLQTQVLGPLFHIDPSGSDPALSYRAGSVRAQDVGAGEILIVMRSVPVSALIEAADAGLVMPPKSTYFEPKVRSGVFLRRTTEEA